MLKRPNPECLDYMLSRKCTPAERRFIVEEDRRYFFLYYFRDYISYGFDEFHYQAFEDLNALDRGDITDLMWLWAREHVKTTFAKANICYMICENKAHYILYDSYEKDNAERNLYDVAIELQTNPYILQDYGQLFFENKNPNEPKKSTKKSIEEFITSNNIKCQAVSTQEPTRGLVFGPHRPDFAVIDDFENTKTKYSYVITKKIDMHLDELKSGMAANGRRLYLANYISDYGNVQRIIDSQKKDPKVKVHRVDVVMNGEIMWKDKYVHTDLEAAALNEKIEEQKMKKVSLETKKRSLNAKGGKIYEQEMLNQPLIEGERVFNSDNIKARIEQDVKAPLDVSGNWKFYGNHDRKHRFGLGADTSEGVGLDANSIVVIDFDTQPRAKVVATYQNPNIDPATFAYEVKYGSLRYGECIMGLEINNTGHATMTKLIEIYPQGNLYQREIPKDLIDQDRKPTRYGWKTDLSTKPRMISELQTAIHDNLLEINDEGLLYELLGYGHHDIRQYVQKEGMTRHFDLLMALAIAWAMRDHAVKKVEKNYYLKQDRQKPFDRHSIV